MNEQYKIYIADTMPDKEIKRKASMGVAILVKPDISCYIHNIQTHEGTAIYVDFFFPQHNRMRVIAVYIPSDKGEISKRTQEKIKS